MTLALIAVPGILQIAGVPVVRELGWETRTIKVDGVPQDMSHVEGVLVHHTAGPLHGDTPSLSTVINGRPDLSGPLAQLLLSRSGVFHMVAAGKANHAGLGAKGTKWEHYAGNSHLIGLEIENTGLENDPWPDAQVVAAARGCAAMLKHFGAPPSMCIGHKEYAVGRKVDPSFAMDAFRTRVASFMGA